MRRNIYGQLKHLCQTQTKRLANHPYNYNIQKKQTKTCGICLARVCFTFCFEKIKVRVMTGRWGLDHICAGPALAHDSFDVLPTYMFQVFLKYICNISLMCVWSMYLICVWSMSHTFVWSTSHIYFEHIPDMFWVVLKYVSDMLKYVWNMFHIYIYIYIFESSGICCRYFACMRT